MLSDEIRKNAIFNSQERLYSFPYHHLPHFDARGDAINMRRLHWGVEYLCLLRWVVEKIQGLRPETMLDVGCGDGALVMHVAPIVKATGVDLSERATTFARAFAGESAEILCQDAARIDREFDLVVAMEVLEHVPDDAVDGFLDTLVARTRSRGHVLITVPTTNVPLNKKHYRHYDAPLMRAQMSAADRGLEEISLDYFYRDSTWLKIYNRLCNNSLFSGEFHIFRRILWRRTWRAARHVSTKDGRHLIAIYRKS